MGRMTKPGDVTMRGGGSLVKLTAHYSFHTVGTSARVLILLPWPRQCDPWKRIKKHTQRDSIKKGCSPRTKNQSMQRLRLHPSSQPLASPLPGGSAFFPSNLRGIPGACACIFKQRHQNPLVNTQDQVFLLSFFNLLKSIYPSSIVITKCHQIFCVR